MYVAGSPDDLAALIDDVAQDILGIQPNVAIWYREATPAADAPADTDDLSQMQLIVLLVTKAFLTTDCTARTVEFPFALSHHIPMLPIANEPGLASQFNQSCGDLQCLYSSASQDDPTAMPYGERLERFLRAVIVGDELASRVRAAFDTRVFLSYRKRDRAEAQRIMRLIHQCPTARDVAIWYDEFLVPGEGFNQAITDAMQACDAFALVVTPNLLQVPNYVMTTEWPRARELGKPVLPIEAVPTNKDELILCFKDLPTPVSAANQQEIVELVTAALASSRQLEHDAEHDYLMGIAHLAGIDMEQDHSRATELLVRAASAGHLGASDRLACMYQTGEGVTRDIRHAIAWQQHYAKLLEQRANESPSIDNLQELYLAVAKCADLQNNEGDTNGAFDSLMRQCAVANRLAEAGDPDGLLKLGWAQREAANLEALAHNWLFALRWYDLSLGNMLAALDKNPSDEVRRNLVGVYGNAALACIGLGRKEQAHEMRRLALELADELVEHAQTNENRMVLAHALDAQGSELRDAGDFEQARTAYQRALELRQVVVDEVSGPRPWHWLAVSRERLGDVEHDLGNTSAAMSHYRAAREIRDALAKRVGTNEANRNQSGVLRKLGNLSYEAGSWDVAAQWYERAAIAIRDVAAQELLDNDIYVLGDMCARAGRSYMQLANYTQAQMWFERAIEAYEVMVERDLDEDDKGFLSSHYSCLASAYCGQGRYDLARAEYERSIAAIRSIAKRSLTTKEKTVLLTSHYELSRLPGMPADERDEHLRALAALAANLYAQSNDDLHGAFLIYATEALAQLGE